MFIIEISYLLCFPQVLHCHDTRQKNDFHMHAVQFEIEKKKIIRNKGTKLWNDLPDDIKQITSPLFLNLG